MTDSSQDTSRTLRNFVGGDYVESLADEHFELVDPSTGRVVGSSPASTAKDVDRAYSAASTAFGAWGATTPAERQMALLKFADALEARSEELARLEAKNTGKPIALTLSEDMPMMLDHLRFFAGAARVLEGKSAGEYMKGFESWVRREPIGVVGQVTPWNYPMMMAIWKIAPALAAGNAMVVKTSEDSTLSALHLAKLATEAGVPDGILNVLTGTGKEIGAAMGLHNDIDVLTFTGSGPVGRSFLESSARSNLKKVSLELGGRAGYIVDSAHASDFPAIAADIVGAAFGTSGQNCTAASRVIFVGDDDDGFAEFRTALINATESLTVGDPFEADTDIGPVINARAHGRITSWVDEAVDQGARILNQRAEVPDTGTWYPPTVIENVPDDSELGRGEIFGPVTQLLQRTSREDAVELINGEPYGLASSVWCEDIAQVRWWASRIRVGTLAVNGYSEGTEATPFGGLRQSGFWGRDNGPEALDTYQETMTVWVADT